MCDVRCAMCNVRNKTVDNGRIEDGGGELTLIGTKQTSRPSAAHQALLSSLSMPTLLIPIFWVGGSGGVGKGAGKGGWMVGLGGRQSPFSPPLTFPKLSLPSTGN